jgi:DNA-binding PadR family transcriptional regulator
MEKSPPGAPALTPAMHHILLALLRGDLHGYAIMQEIEKLTEGSMRLGPGTLYTNLPKLLDAKLVEESDHHDAGDDERRRYYRLTSSGRAAVLEESRRLQRLVKYAGRHARIEA